MLLLVLLLLFLVLASSLVHDLIHSRGFRTPLLRQHYITNSGTLEFVPDGLRTNALHLQAHAEFPIMTSTVQMGQVSRIALVQLFADLAEESTVLPRLLQCLSASYLRIDRQLFSTTYQEALRPRIRIQKTEIILGTFLFLIMFEFPLPSTELIRLLFNQSMLGLDVRIEI